MTAAMKENYYDLTQLSSEEEISPLAQPKHRSRLGTSKSSAKLSMKTTRKLSLRQQSDPVVLSSDDDCNMLRDTLSTLRKKRGEPATSLQHRRQHQSAPATHHHPSPPSVLTSLSRALSAEYHPNGHDHGVDNKETTRIPRGMEVEKKRTKAEKELANLLFVSPGTKLASAARSKRGGMSMHLDEEAHAGQRERVSVAVQNDDCDKIPSFQ